MNNNKIIKDYIKKDELDLEIIIEDYSAYIETIIENMSKGVLSKEDKEEISSEVLFVLWKNTSKLDDSKRLSPYIAGVTRNVVKEYLKKKNIVYDISDYENVLSNNREIELMEENLEEIKKIEKSLEKMKEKDKKVFIDYYYSSKSIKDIAIENKITEFSVKQRLYRIRNRIKKEVK